MPKGMGKTINVPITLGWDNKKIIGHLIIDSDVPINWLVKGFSEAIILEKDQTKLYSVGIIDRSDRLNK